MARAVLLLLGAIWIAAVKADDSCDEGELANVQMLQTKSQIAAETPLARWAGTSHFIDNDDIVCAEGNADDVEGALALRKAGLLGSLFSFVHAYKGPCSEEGFNKKDKHATDEMYPGITLFYKNKDGREQFKQNQTEALANYSKDWNLPVKKVQQLHACTCHKDSALRKGEAKACTKVLDNQIGSWFVVDTLGGGRPMTCKEGSFYQATMSLAIAKSSQLSMMHMRDQVAPVPCSERGFKYDQQADDCYAGMHMFTKTSKFESDKGWQDMQEGIKGIKSEMKDNNGNGVWGYMGNVNGDVLGRTYGCHCSAKSKERKNLPKATKCGVGSSSPIRDWLED